MNYQQKTPANSDSSDTIAMIIEIIFGLFGILGMGWLYASNLSLAIAAFIGFAILVFIEAAIVGATLGFALCIIIPFNLAVAVVSGLRVRDYVRNTGVTGSIVHLVVGLVIGGMIMCGGLSLLTLVFGGLTTFLSGMSY